MSAFIINLIKETGRVRQYHTEIVNAVSYDFVYQKFHSRRDNSKIMIDLDNDYQETKCLSIFFGSVFLVVPSIFVVGCHLFDPTMVAMIGTPLIFGSANITYRAHLKSKLIQSVMIDNPDFRLLDQEKINNDRVQE